MSLGIIPESWMGHLHAALRIATGLLFLEHGTAKLFKFPLTEAYKDSIHLLSFTGITAEFEFAGGILIVIGLFTRATAFVLAGMMGVAYFLAHAPQSLFPIINMGELATMFCFVFLYLAAAGAGPYNLDTNWK